MRRILIACMAALFIAGCAATTVTQLGTMKLSDGTCSEGQIDSLQDIVHQEMSVVRTYRCPCGEKPTPAGSCEAEVQAVVGNPSVIKTFIGGASAIGAAAVFPATKINNAVSAAANGGTANARGGDANVGDVTNTNTNTNTASGSGAPAGPL